MVPDAAPYRPDYRWVVRIAKGSAGAACPVPAVSSSCYHPGNKTLDPRSGCYHLGNKKDAQYRSQWVHIVTWTRIREFIEKHANADPPMRAWRKVVKAARWAGPEEMKRAFPSAVIRGKYLTIFHIGGNKFRLICDVRYDLGRVYVREVWTHEEYNRRSNVEKE
jgi:mRNA interferase HigB